MERKKYRKRQPQVLCDCPNETIYPTKIRKNFVEFCRIEKSQNLKKIKGYGFFLLVFFSPYVRLEHKIS